MLYLKCFYQELIHYSELHDHPNIVKFIDASIERSESDGGKYIYILSELCKGGHLLDLLEKYKGRLRENQILHIMKHVVRGVK